MGRCIAILVLILVFCDYTALIGSPALMPIKSAEGAESVITRPCSPDMDLGCPYNWPESLRDAPPSNRHRTRREGDSTNPSPRNGFEPPNSRT